jgi:hypothetical protein
MRTTLHGFYFWLENVYGGYVYTRLQPVYKPFTTRLPVAETPVTLCLVHIIRNLMKQLKTFTTGDY